jgi:catechol 2,3-dioxygenase-like lactoylglutathione lyase family enzyme
MLGDATVYATVAVRDMQLSKDFYEGKLGLRQVDENPGGIMYESGSGKIFVYQSDTAGSGQATCAAWLVSDVEKTVADLQASGVVFENYDMPDAQVDGVIYTMGGQKAAWFKDPDGNILNIGSEG